MQVLLGLLTLVALAFLAFLAISFIWTGLTSVSPELLGPLLLSSGTVISVVITVVVGQFLQRRAGYEQAQRPTKVAVYERFMDTWFDLLQVGKVQSERKPIQPDDPKAVGYMAQFARELILWGSAKVLTSYSHFTARVRVQTSAKSADTLFDFEKVLIAMRSDLGHSNRGIEKGDVLRLFVTDIDRHLQLPSSKKADRNPEDVIRDERWPVARLIPITSSTGVEAKERNAASALLAVLSVVDEFGRALLKPLGASAGKIEAFVEIPFKTDAGLTVRPDGLIGVTRAGRTWWALVECKIADQQLTADQMEAYLDLARLVGIDAVLSISNHYTTTSSQYPIQIDRKKLRKVSIHHWSWVRVLTEAEVQKQYRGVRDPDQAYILGELIRYLSDPRSGVVQFDDMGPSWTAVREGARLHSLRKSDAHVSAIASRWDELVRFLSLDLTKELGRDVKDLLRREESTAVARHQSLRDSLASKGRLYAELQIPHAAGPLEVVADLGSRQVIVSTLVDAPHEGRSRGRISWLLRQLLKAPSDLTIEAKISRSSATITGQLDAIRDDPMVLAPM